MVKREYTQTVRPVSRIPEKIFGWLAWLTLLAISGFILYSLLVSGNDPNFMENTTSELERQISTNPEIGDFMENNNLTPQEFVDSLLSAGWYLLAFLALPLIIGLIGLLSMKKRILAGILLLIAGLLTLPLFAIFWIPLFFLIAAILLFVRKDKVIRNDDYYDDNRRDTYDRHREAAPTYVERDETLDRKRDYTYDADDVRSNDNNYSDNRQNRTVVDDEVIRSDRDNAYYVDNDAQSGNVTHDDHYVSNDASDYDRDRVKYVDKTKDATAERRQNYNDRMNNRD
ncbi:DUF4064 domain-containing protein [Macrococcus lamae]|uniref:DUF4064 domain-containing protein n=1 Tax=Macrococcus lamae TaxID=198484 RepID=A0A4V3BEP6_9STAP|nr:DUF4064 domain-containing protein [Macrococcus lamae]TDM05161.1 DUF4064 domain-containing protein [Macrococcus lamae]